MSAAQRFGWTLDDLHERIAACEALGDGVSGLETDDVETWTASASLAFLRLVDEVVSMGSKARPPCPLPLLRRIRKLDEDLSPSEVARAADRLRSWLVRQESDLPVLPDPDEAAIGLPSIDDTDGPDNLVALPRGAIAKPGDARVRLRGLQTERWVAIPARGDVRKRVAALRQALGGLALILSAANADDDVPFGTLDRKRLAMVVDAARHCLGGPLAERGLLKAVRENAHVLERQGSTEAVRSTGKRTRIALDVLLSDLG